MTGSTKFRKLLEPGYIGSVRTKNHILKTGATLGFYPWEERMGLPGSGPPIGLFRYSGENKRYQPVVGGDFYTG